MVTRGNGKWTVEMERNVDRDDKSPSETKMGQGIGHSETCIYGVITVACLRFQNATATVLKEGDIRFGTRIRGA
ncbi:hypothetical protein VNO80_07147 [Phaseolus coccineus]|uniref:Uncharacterized protein n=1 Tax=Phaseolus coccineus TaxID=3886 RepID=A0AAN9RI74_PHACN